MSNKRTWTDWVVALRPWSFSTSAIPVLVTVAYLFFLDHTPNACFPVTNCDYLNGFLSLLMIMLLHGGGNLVSDYSDNIHLVDLPGSQNGVRSMESGLFKPREIYYYGLSLLAVGAALGLVILFRSSFEVLWIGILAVALPLGYPWLKAHALGDVDILLCFALLPAVGTSFVITGSYHAETLLLCLPFGLHIVSILHANNTRDRANDHRAGLVTLPLLLGWNASRWLYVAEIAVPYLMVALIPTLLLGNLSLLALLVVLLTLPLAVRNIKVMMQAKTEDAQDIASLDQMTAQVQLLFGLLYAAGFVLAAFL